MITSTKTETGIKHTASAQLAIDVKSMQIARLLEQQTTNLQLAITTGDKLRIRMHEFNIAHYNKILKKLAK